MSFWISDSFTENNLCEVVRGIAGDLAEEVCPHDGSTYCQIQLVDMRGPSLMC